MIPWLRTCTAFIEDPSSVPSTQTYILTLKTPVIGKRLHFLDSVSTSTHIHIPSQEHIHIHIIKDKINFLLKKEYLTYLHQGCWPIHSYNPGAFIWPRELASKTDIIK